MYEIRLSRQADKFLEKASPVLKRKMDRCFEQLARDPRNPANAKRLRGEPPRWRYRVGNYRVIYEIIDQELVVLIEKIANRSSAYN